MVWCKLLCCCFSNNSLQINPSLVNEDRIKECNECYVKNSLITLKCGHIYCIKCYNSKKQICNECKKNKYVFKIC